jgi:hypothetical protein
MLTPFSVRYARYALPGKGQNMLEGTKDRIRSRLYAPVARTAELAILGLVVGILALVIAIAAMTGAR